MSENILIPESLLNYYCWKNGITKLISAIMENFKYGIGLFFVVTIFLIQWSIPAFNASNINGLTVWVDAASAQTNSSGVVTSWPNLVSDGVVPSVSGSPTKLRSAVNGNPAVQFSPGKSVKFSPLGGALNKGSGAVYIVTKQNRATNQGTVFKYGLNWEGLALYGGGANGYKVVANWDGIWKETTFSASGQFEIVRLLFEGINMRCLLNLNEVYNLNNSKILFDNGDEMMIGGTGGDPMYPYYGEIAEVLVFGGGEILNYNEMVYGYLAQKYLDITYDIGLDWREPKEGSVYESRLPLYAVALKGTPPFEFSVLIDNVSKLILTNTGINETLIGSQLNNVAAGKHKVSLAVREIFSGISFTNTRTIVFSDTEIEGSKPYWKSVVFRPDSGDPLDSVAYLCLPQGLTGDVAVSLYNNQGLLIRSLLPPTPLTEETVLTWNGDDGYGISQPSGTYVVHITSKYLSLFLPIQIIR